MTWSWALTIGVGVLLLVLGGTLAFLFAKTPRKVASERVQSPNLLVVASRNLLPRQANEGDLVFLFREGRVLLWSAGEWHQIDDAADSSR